MHKLIMPFKRQMMLCGYKNAEYQKYWGYPHYGVDISTIQGKMIFMGLVGKLMGGKGGKDGKIKAGGFDKYYVDHGTGIYPSSAAGVPFNAMAIASKEDALASIHEDLAAEQKARAMYDNILRLSDDPDVNDVIKFLRQREVVHFQRFGEAMNILRDKKF